MENLDVCKLVQEFMDKQEWKYTYDEENKALIAGFSFAGKIRRVKLFVDFNYDDCYLVTCPLPMNASEEAYTEVMRLMNRINYSSKFGNFEMDEDDGEIRYRLAVDIDRDCISEEIIEKSIKIPLAMVRRHSEDLIAVMMGHKTYEEVSENI